MVVVMTSALLAGCEPFPSDTEVASASADKPAKTQEQPKAPAVNTPTTSGTEKQSDASPTKSTESPASVPQSPVVEQKEVHETNNSVSTENTPAVKPEEPEPVVEDESDTPQLAPNAGKLQIIGSAGKEVYYMKKVTQPDANCYVVSNSVTWDTSVSCVPAANTPVTSGK
jgi:hypothetical protein